MQGIISTTRITTPIVNSSSISPCRLRGRSATRAAAAADAPSPRRRRRATLLAAKAGTDINSAKTNNANANANANANVKTNNAAPFACRRCLRRVASPQDNHGAACSFHPALYSGGEAGKALGFVRASADPAEQLLQKTGRRGLMRFWDCCGQEDREAEGCEKGWHVSFDDEENARRGWK